MNSAELYIKMSRHKGIKYQVMRWLAKKLGYTCIPKDYPNWLTTSANHNGIRARYMDLTSHYMAGLYTGKAASCNEIAAEIIEFENIK